MDNSTNIDCSSLAVRKHFKDYIQALNLTFTGNFNLVEKCKPQVCNALWGSGNPDISGIGVSKLDYRDI
jgi:hypothetical protein